MKKSYLASLSRSQGRSAWAIIFRHPVRVDPKTGQPGLRVRQGLGTHDDAEANMLKDQLNLILANEQYWSVAARSEIEGRFDPKVVKIFFHGMEPEEREFAAIREAVIPLPTPGDSGYRRVLLLGTTGAGKTTLLRQLIGTDPIKERFPSTSTAKTTIHDTEIVLADGSYRAVVTFVPSEEVREHVNECISQAVLAVYREEADDEVMRKLLVHVDQRFRFNYVLGDGPLTGADEDEDEDEQEEQAIDQAEDAEGTVDRAITNDLLTEILESVKSKIATDAKSRFREELGSYDEKEQRTADELFEEELDHLLREDEAFHKASDGLMDEIELRFGLLRDGVIHRNKQGWPESWSWATEDRASFIKTISSFSSNHHPRFGTLLTPLVNGIRIAGPFQPEWSEGARPKLVLLDGEGLGHNPKSVTSVPTSVTRSIEAADAVILVDNATGPMQHAPVGAMEGMVTSGCASKLMLVFTHFDGVKGDNLPRAVDREQHVLASAENVLANIGQKYGPGAQRALRSRVHTACFFLGAIDGNLDPRKGSHRRTINQLKGLLSALEAEAEEPASVAAKPVYNSMDLVLAIKKAAQDFRGPWMARLGLPNGAGAGKEHWTRIKALSRRLADPARADEYQELKPVADLYTHLQSQLFILLQKPVRWEPSEPMEDSDKQQVFETLARAVATRTLELASRRVRTERLPEWQEALNQSGKRSSYARAEIIGNRIYERAAPIPDATPSPDRNSFLHDVAAIIEQVCKDSGALLT